VGVSVEEGVTVEVVEVERVLPALKEAVVARRGIAGVRTGWERVQMAEGEGEGDLQGVVEVEGGEVGVGVVQGGFEALGLERGDNKQVCPGVDTLGIGQVGYLWV